MNDICTKIFDIFLFSFKQIFPFILKYKYIFTLWSAY